MNKLVDDICPPSTTRSVAWEPFTRKLAAVLAELLEDQYLILSQKHSHRFVQFAAQGAFGMRAETVSNSYLAKHEQLSELQLSALLDAGWHNPSGTPTDSTPAADPDGSPNFYKDFPAPVSFETVANLTVQTFIEVLQVPHPGRLQYYSFDDTDGAMIDLPELGLKVADRSPQGDVSYLLKETIKKATGIADLVYDKDGDLCVRYGSALAYVRLINDRQHVRIFAVILNEVPESHRIYVRLNNLNRNETFARFFFLNGAVFCVSDIHAAPLISAHITEAFGHFCNIADDMGRLLQSEFGGQTAFAEPMSSTMRH